MYKPWRYTKSFILSFLGPDIFLCSLLFLHAFLFNVSHSRPFCNAQTQTAKKYCFYNLTNLPESKLPDLIQNALKMLQEFLELKYMTETHKDRQEIFVPVIFTNTEFPKYKFYTWETKSILQELFNAGLNTSGRSLRSSDVVRSTPCSPRWR